MSMNLRLPLIVGLALAVAAGAMGAATVALVSPPATLQPGQATTINVQCTKTSNEVEQRLVLILELRRSSDNTVIHKVVSENAPDGHREASKTVAIPLTVPVGATGSHYFAAYASPWSMNKYFVTNYLGYPRNGTFTYLWSGGGYGVTQNCWYLGSLICPKPSGNTTYCSGLAFEAFLLPYNTYNTTYGHTRIGNITSSSQMETYRKLWYGVTDAEKLSVRAITDYSLGREITDWEEAQDGDFCQFWRTSGSGHNPVFQKWIRNGAGQITGFTYWGSQGSTNGIGFNTESFAVGTGSGVRRDRFYLGRVKKPRDQADYDWAIGQASTVAQPTMIQTGSAVQEWDRY